MQYCTKCHTLFHKCDCEKDKINTGSNFTKNEKCFTCGGRGMAFNLAHSLFSAPDGYYTCPHCGGTGTIN